MIFNFWPFFIYASRFKDGKPYPWSSETLSSLILYPEEANQTIYTRNAGKIDQGKYLCVLRNDTHKSEHHIHLQIKSKKFIFCNQLQIMLKRIKLYWEIFFYSSIASFSSVIPRRKLIIFSLESLKRFYYLFDWSFHC